MTQTQTVNRTYRLEAPVRDAAALSAAMRAIVSMTDQRAKEIMPGYLQQFPRVRLQPRYFFDDKRGAFTGVRIAVAPKDLAALLEAAYLTLDEKAALQRAAINRVVPIFFQYDESLEPDLEV